MHPREEEQRGRGGEFKGEENRRECERSFDGPDEKSLKEGPWGDGNVNRRPSFKFSRLRGKTSPLLEFLITDKSMNYWEEAVISRVSIVPLSLSRRERERRKG